MAIAILMAKVSSIDFVAKAAKSRVSSVMKHLPQAPDHSLRRLDLQCTIAHMHHLLQWRILSQTHPAPLHWCLTLKRTKGVETYRYHCFHQQRVDVARV